MASRQQVKRLTEELICSICLDFFIDPVSLECDHSFCRRCITEYWEKEESNSCPECREVFADSTLRVNRALASLSEKARKPNLNPTEQERKLHCEEHQEELKLFCETDKKLICVICAAAREHKSHNFMLVKEAVETYKTQMKFSIESLTKNTDVMKKMEKRQKRKISGQQSCSLQSHITSEFTRMHQILVQKEQRLLRDLKEEEERILNRMEKNLQKIQGNLNSKQQKLSNLQKRMDQKDSLIFLKEEARQQRRVRDEEQALSVADDVRLFAKFDHPYLLNTALKEILPAIKQVCVTLDVETAGTGLEVSEDLKSVRWTGIWRSLPDTVKRFTVQECVLGSEGFTSGRHYWEVEGNQWWRMGVAAESVERERGVDLIPENGVWSIGRGGDEFYVNTSPRSSLPVGPVPGRVGVYLSYESGTVSFYNADTKSHLHSFTGIKFTEKIYPFFGTWDENQWLTVCCGSAPDL